MSQYFIWLGVNHLSLCDYPYSRFYAGYKYNVAIIDIDGVSLLSLTSLIIWPYPRIYLALFAEVKRCLPSNMHFPWYENKIPFLSKLILIFTFCISHICRDCKILRLYRIQQLNVKMFLVPVCNRNIDYLYCQLFLYYVRRFL